MGRQTRYMQYFRLLPAVIAITVCVCPRATRADDTAAQAAARQALMQQMSNPDNGVQETNAPAVAPAQPVAPPQTNLMPTMPPLAPPPPMTVTPPLSSQPMSNTTNMLADTNAVVQYPVNPALNAAPQTNGAPIVVPPVITQNPPPVPPTSPAPAPVSTPSQPAPLSMTAPPLPISAAQQQELDALLAQYRANQISPAQYQSQRAKILAGQ